MNVKTAASILGVDTSWVYQVLKASGINNKVKGQYEITEEIFEIIKNPPKAVRVKTKESRYGISGFKVRNLANRIGLSVNDKKIPRAVALYKTGFYTVKGIDHFINKLH